jgi:hypothetical protein
MNDLDPTCSDYPLPEYTEDWLTKSQVGEPLDLEDLAMIARCSEVALLTRQAG